MSEVQKPVEETVVAPTTETPAVVEPVAESKPVEETPVAPVEATTETPVVTELAPATEAEPVKEEAKPIEEGILGYKAPGLLKSFIFSKKHFWFGSEPVESKHLSSYLRGEKPEHANHNAAWASHTGKGLLFFAKKSSEKTSPAGVINLSDASEPVPEGTVDFFLTVHGQKNTFQAATPAERDNWVATLKTKITEAKELSESVTGTDAYKNTHSSLSKPVVAAATAPKKSTEIKKEEKAEAKEEKKEEKKEIKEEKKEEKAEAKEEKKEEKKEIKEEKKEEKKARKDRSASRKRNSIFGSIGFGKKEEKVEPKEETAVAPIAAEEAAVPVETAPVQTEAPVVAPVVPEAATEAPVVPVEETKAAEAKPAASKRNSIFGTLQSKFSSSSTPKEKKVEEAAPAVPAKDAEPVAETAPVIPAVETTEPLAASVASPATVPTETTTVPATNGETAAVEAPTVKNDKRKSSLPWLNKKEKTTTTSDEETEKPKSPFAKLRATVKGKTSPKAAEKTAEKPSEEVAAPTQETTETPAISEPVATEPVVSEPVSAVPASTPQVSATA